MKEELKLILKELSDLKGISFKKIEELKEATISIYSQNLQLVECNREKEKTIERLERELSALKKK
jgi:hypothetical protein